MAGLLLYLDLIFFNLVFPKFRRYTHWNWCVIFFQRLGGLYLDIGVIIFNLVLPTLGRYTPWNWCDNLLFNLVFLALGSRLPELMQYSFLIRSYRRLEGLSLYLDAIFLCTLVILTLGRSTLLSCCNIFFNLLFLTLGGLTHLFCFPMSAPFPPYHDVIFLRFGLWSSWGLLLVIDAKIVLVWSFQCLGGVYFGDGVILFLKKIIEVYNWVHLFDRQNRTSVIGFSSPSQ